MGNYSVYVLLDYQSKPFYVGLTKNWDLRLTEHVNCDRKNLKKDYRVRRCIEHHGELLHRVKHGFSLVDARRIEKSLIYKWWDSLVNKQHGQTKSGKKRINKLSRLKTCPTCGKRFRRLGGHKCGKKKRSTGNSSTK